MKAYDARQLGQASRTKLVDRTKLVPRGRSKRRMQSWQRKHRHRASGTRPGRREKGPAVPGAVRRRAGPREKGAGECTPGAQVAGFGYAATGRKRRPRRRPSRQGIGADDHRAARTRRREAAARVSAIAGGQPRKGGQGGHPPHHALRVLRQRHELLFATAFDGDWDAYIDDFVAKIPDYLDIIDSAWDGWPGIRSPGAKDYLAKHQITAEGWYVAYPDLTVAEIHRLKRIGKAVDEFLDKIG